MPLRDEKDLTKIAPSAKWILFVHDGGFRMTDPYNNMSSYPPLRCLSVDTDEELAAELLTYESKKVKFLLMDANGICNHKFFLKVEHARKPITPQLPQKDKVENTVTIYEEEK